MAMTTNRRRIVEQLLFCAVAACLSGPVMAGKPVATIFSEVQISFAGQTSGFSGSQDSFSQSQNGGRIVMDLTTLGTPLYDPLPQIDTSGLDIASNHWEVVTKVGNRSYSFVGTCASLTYATVESGLTVRHLFLNCRDLESTAAP